MSNNNMDYLDQNQNVFFKEKDTVPSKPINDRYAPFNPNLDYYNHKKAVVRARIMDAITLLVIIGICFIALQVRAEEQLNAVNTFGWIVLFGVIAAALILLVRVICNFINMHK